MLDLADLSILLLFIAVAAWLWRGHGIRERALALVRRHCAQAEIILLDDNVALQRLRWLADSRGQRRLARVYGFEFTVTGEQRHTGSISMFGQHLGKIELAAHPVSNPAFSAEASIEPATWQPRHYAPGHATLTSKSPDTSVIATYRAATPSSTPSAEIIQLHDWRQKHPPTTPQQPAEQLPAEASAEQPAEPPPTRH
jgi:hypothetical protein